MYILSTVGTNHILGGNKYGAEKYKEGLTTRRTLGGATTRAEMVIEREINRG
jgi:hypothetical protein